ncbi:hypothetical protein [Mucilaginibacter sp. CSA2-8R]|uniref:hypothetical protein n=1 Tax=Mucilaginibacter sp. CSA2-8R TaxID=3141542 RepID=UPI00315CC545
MGFGFGIFFIVILIPATALLLIIWAISRKRVFGKALGCLWMFVFVLGFLSVIFRGLFDKKNLNKNDYHGTYVINRSYFAGKQADWQYNHFRFEIKDNDSIYFYVTNEAKILKTYKGTVSTTTDYASARLILNMEANTHHIMRQDPTAIRGAWSFTLAFRSPKFNNVYFKKGDWEPIR